MNRSVYGGQAEVQVSREQARELLRRHVLAQSGKRRRLPSNGEFIVLAGAVRPVDDPPDEPGSGVRSRVNGWARMHDLHLTNRCGEFWLYSPTTPRKHWAKVFKIRVGEDQGD